MIRILAFVLGLCFATSAHAQRATSSSPTSLTIGSTPCSLGYTCSTIADLILTAPILNSPTIVSPVIALTAGHLFVGNGSNLATDVAVSGDLTLASSGAFALASGNAGVLNAGTLLAARMPALTGDVTTSAGSVATTLAAGSASNLNSGTLPSARLTGSYTGITGLGTLTTGATGAGFTVALATSTITGAVPAANMPAHTGDVTSSAGSVALTLAAGSASVLNSGTLPAGRLPALTGDVTTSAGSAATTVSKIQTVTISGVTGTGNVVLSAAPTITGTATFSGLITANGGIKFGGGSAAASTCTNISNTVLCFTDTGGVQWNNATNTVALFTVLNSGLTGILNSAPTYTLDVTGTMRVTAAGVYFPGLGTSSAATSGTVCYTTGSGATAGLINVDTTVACLASDERLKDISGPLEGSLDRIVAMRPMVYTWKAGSTKVNTDPGIHYGLGAFATAYASESLIARDTEGNPRAWRQDAVIADLVGAIQEQQRQINTLRGAR